MIGQALVLHPGAVNKRAPVGWTEPGVASKRDGGFLVHSVAITLSLWPQKSTNTACIGHKSLKICDRCRLVESFGSVSRGSACAVPFYKCRIYGIDFRGNRSSGPLCDQALEPQLPDGREVLLDSGKRWPEKCRFRDVIKAHYGNICRHPDATLFKGSNRTQRHLIIGYYQRGKFFAVILYQVQGRFKT